MGITGLIERVEKLSDKRRTSHENIQHKLVDIVIIGFLTILSKGQTFVDMEAYAETRVDWLREKVSACRRPAPSRMWAVSQTPAASNGPMQKKRIIP